MLPRNPAGIRTWNPRDWKRLRIGIIGSGIAGLTVANCLHRRHKITVFETVVADRRPHQHRPGRKRRMPPTDRPPGSSSTTSQISQNSQSSCGRWMWSRDQPRCRSACATTPAESNTAAPHLAPCSRNAGICFAPPSCECSWTSTGSTGDFGIAPYQVNSMARRLPSSWLDISTDLGLSSTILYRWVLPSGRRLRQHSAIFRAGSSSTFCAITGYCSWLGDPATGSSREVRSST